MLRRSILLPLLLVAIRCFAQIDGPAYVSNGVFVQDTNVAQVLGLWQHYLASHPDSVYDNPYWNSEEKRRYPKFDLAAYEFSSNLYVMMEHYAPTVISITSDDGSLYRIRTLYAATDSIYADPLAIVDVYADRSDGSWKLRNALLVNTANWQHRAVGHVHFVFPSSHVFDSVQAARMNTIGDSLARLFGVPPIDVDYYFADKRLDQLRALGYYYQIGEEAGRVPSGKADYQNRILYSGGLGEFYPHELTHIYVGPRFPNIPVLWNEGLATFMGGSRGQSVSEVIQRASQLLDRRPDFDPDSLFDWVNLDQMTNTAYVAGGLLIEIAYEQGGWPNILAILSRVNEKTSNQEISKLLGVPQNKVAGALLREIHRRGTAQH